MTGPALLRQAAFLDRDGVINVDKGYVHRVDDLEFTPTAVAAIARMNRTGRLVIVVTNQSGVARGMFGMADVDRFHAEIQRRLKTAGAWIDAFYVAPFHPAGVIPDFAVDHPDRKPGPGMLLRAIADHAIDPERSFLIGDRSSDLEAARCAGVRGVLVVADICDLDQTVTDLLSPTGNYPAGRPCDR